MKRLISITLVIALAFTLLAACKSTGDTATKPDLTAQNAQNAPTSQNATPAIETKTPSDFYVVKYAVNDGTDYMLPIETTKSTSDTATLTDTVPKRDGYKFLGWSPYQDASDPMYASGANYSRRADITLYAIWQINKNAETAAETKIFYLLADDNPDNGGNAFADTAYMGTNNGVDGSIDVNLADKSVDPIYGNTSAKFTYATPASGAHWSGVALLWSTQGWRDHGPDLRAFSKLKFWVRGHGGRVKFFVEGNGSAQKTTYVELTDEWQEVTLDLGNWDYINVPFGWACNERDSNERSEIQFWIDGLRFVG